MSAGICQIGIFRDHVRLGFIHGAFLPDPDGLLVGEPKYKKHLRIYHYEDAPWEYMRELIRRSSRFDPYTLKERCQMISSQKRIILLIGIGMSFVLVACGTTTSKCTNQPHLLLPSRSPTQSYALATPYAQEPAAGICASFDGTIVKVSLNPDIPDPRCMKVSADQKLNIINNTQNTLEVTIGRFTASLEPGKETTFDTPFGEYLQPGVHQIQVTPCCGAELWLEDNK